jgi:hypothetical protein
VGLLVSCRHAAPRLDGPPCVVPLKEYVCRGGKCPPFATAVEAAREEKRPFCPMGYSVGTCGELQVLFHNGGLQHRTEYYDREGTLISVSMWLDSPAFCDGRSFSQRFGPDPACAIQVTETMCDERK